MQMKGQELHNYGNHSTVETNVALYKSLGFFEPPIKTVGVSQKPKDLFILNTVVIRIDMH